MVDGGAERDRTETERYKDVPRSPESSLAVHRFPRSFVCVSRAATASHRRASSWAAWFVYLCSTEAETDADKSR